MTGVKDRFLVIMEIMNTKSLMQILRKLWNFWHHLPEIRTHQLDHRLAQVLYYEDIVDCQAKLFIGILSWYLIELMKVKSKMTCL